MSDKDQAQHIYRVFFHNQGQVYELYAHNIYQSDLYGFVEIEDYTFGNRSGMVIDPSSVHAISSAVATGILSGKWK